MFGRTKIAMLVAEFLGTAVLASIILATSKSGVGFSLFIAMAAGITLGVVTLLVGASSGAHINPAVTIGLWTVRKIRTTQAIAFIAAQMLGGLAAWALVTYLTNESLKNIAGETFDWRVLVAEAVGAFLLAFAMAAAAWRQSDVATQALMAAGGLFLGILIASIAANGLVNPAVALGLRSWSKAYVIGPLIGGIVGANLYTILFAPSVALRQAWPTFKTTSRAVAAKPAARGRAGRPRKRR